MFYIVATIEEQPSTDLVQAFFRHLDDLIQERDRDLLSELKVMEIFGPFFAPFFFLLCGCISLIIPLPLVWSYVIGGARLRKSEALHAFLMHSKRIRSPLIINSIFNP